MSAQVLLREVRRDAPQNFSGTRCYARKEATSTYERTPQQGTYVPLWESG